MKKKSFILRVAFKLILILVLFFSACNSPKNPETDSRFDGNRKMAKLLDSLNNSADPDINYFLSGRRAARLQQKGHSFTESDDIIRWETKYCFELLNAGNTEYAIKNLLLMINNYKGGAGNALQNPEFKKVFDLLAVANLRLGESENCLSNHNSASCIMPLQENAVHKIPKGSSNAIDLYSDILKVYPNDLQSKWLLNIAYMTLGQYPLKVPSKHLIPFDELDEPAPGFIPFKNLAVELGIDVNNLAGASIIEDFNNDGWMDIFCTSYGLFDEVKLFIADGKGSYSNESGKAMLSGIVGGLNAKQADFNNDGWMDILILRGAWLDKGGEWPNSLLRNNGDGTFSDITISSGMLSFCPTETATWADVNNDGLLDVFVANENNDANEFPCELFVNNGNETFTDVAKDWGLDGNFGWAKAAVFADFNNDGLQDLFISCLNQSNKLFMNRGQNNKSKRMLFENIAEKAGITLPFQSFPALVFDYNNDGLEDIFCTSFPMDKLGLVGEEAAKEYLRIASSTEKAKLYKNQGNETFQDVSKSMGLDKIIFAMGFNFGDLDNDGWLDVYAGTGAFEYTSLVPNRVFKNEKGTHFSEITMASGMAHLQKGHGISFGDLDNDGDQDLYITLGGAVEGDNAHNALFANPNHKNHWITLMLEGVGSAKDGQTSRVKIVSSGPEGRQVFYHTIGSGGSFGANSIQLEAGLGNASTIESVEILWMGDPKKKEVFTNLPIDKVVKIVQGSKKFTVVQRLPIPLKGNGNSNNCCKK